MNIKYLFSLLVLPVLIVVMVGCQTYQPHNCPLDCPVGDNQITNNLPGIRYPSLTWQQYATPEEAGWSATKLAKAKKFADSVGSAAVMAIHDGAVVAAWGDVDRPFMVHSIRKGFLNALYGIHVARNHLDLEYTLAELQIDDQPPLTEAEKQATVLDLLKSRSGVYHLAAYETKGWQEKRPPRGSHAPGTFWYYNNWDFNTLLTIFEQKTKTHIFAEFQKRIAGPLQMQDYRVRDGYYHFEPVSSHPAYLFRMSARDMARFGWLYLNNGQWAGQQIIPSSWITKSTQPHSKTGMGDSYGYLWWVFENHLKQYEGYYASGGDPQMIVVLPKLKLVFVHLGNTYAGHQVSKDDVLHILDLLLEAQTGEAVSTPALTPLPQSPPPVQLTTISTERLRPLAQTYTYSGGQSVEIKLIADQLVMDFGFGQFGLRPTSETEFLVEGTHERVIFTRTEAGIRQLIYETLKTNPFKATTSSGPAIASPAGKSSR